MQNFMKNSSYRYVHGKLLLAAHTVEQGILKYRNYIFEKPPQIFIHNHGGIEVYMLLSSHAEYSVEGNLYGISKGDIIVTAGSELHAPIPADDVAYQRIVIEVNPEYIKEFAASIEILSFFSKKKPGINNKITAAAAKKYGIHEIVYGIERQTGEEYQEKELIIKTYVVQLLVALKRAIEDSNEPYTTNKIVEDCIEFINNNLDKPLTHKIISDELYISKYYLSRLFRKCTGLSISEYILNKRIMKAQKLMDEGVPLAGIPELIGLGDYSCFYRNFKKATNMSPREYIKTNNTPQ